MLTRCFERGREDEKGYEVINLSDYGFEYFVDNKMVRNGLIEGFNDVCEMLLEEGFTEVV